MFHKHTFLYCVGQDNLLVAICCCWLIILITPVTKETI